MKNWSGYIRWQPAEILKPSSEEEIQHIILRAAREGKKVRTIGSGHSFVPLSETDQILVSLDEYQGLLSIDPETHQVRVKAGTKLFALNETLYTHGLALENLGDIDVQSIAGAISTGTHGTGTAFGNISTQVTALTLINGEGKRITCSPSDKPALFKAAQVSLGALGIITEVSLQCVPAYTLDLRIDQGSLHEVLAQYEELNAQNRNFEFYWFPHTEKVMTKLTNLTEEAAKIEELREDVQLWRQEATVTEQTSTAVRRI